MTSSASTVPASVLLVPGYWRGAWVWDACADRLRELGCRVEAVTLPGLEAEASDRDTMRPSPKDPPTGHQVGLTTVGEKAAQHGSG